MIYRKDIDFYRAISVIAVILFHHFDDVFKNGYLGVDIFFVISGFLITSQIYTQLSKKNFSISSFYLRRVRRILPLLLFFILSALILSINYLLPNELLKITESSLFSISFIPNFYFWKVINYFDPVSFNKAFLHLWSLGIEEQFYIIFPFFCLFVYKINNSDNFQLFTILVILFFSIFLYLTFYYKYPEEVFYFPITRAWELLIGSLVFFFIKREFNINNIYLIFLSIFILLFLFSNFYIDGYFLRILICLSAGLILTRDNSAIFNKTYFKLFIFIGKISFGLYLWHYLFISLNNILEAEINQFFIFFSYFAISIFTYYLIEKPFKNQNIISNKILFLTLTLSLSFILILIIVINLNKGFIDNYPEQKKYLLQIDNKESSNYVIEKFNQYKNKSFKKVQNGNIVIIGDSYAQDFVNIFGNINQKNQNLNIITKYISVECNNLFLEDMDKFSANYCKDEQQFYDDKLIENIKLSKIVYLASYWKKDQIKQLAESISNIKKITNAKVYVVGIKKFSKKSIRKLLKISEPIMNNYIEILDNDAFEINNFLIKNFKEDYIDLINLYCEKKCKIFDQGKLLSYDGNHLTKHGVEYFSNKLKFDYRIKLRDN